MRTERSEEKKSTTAASCTHALIQPYHDHFRPFAESKTADCSPDDQLRKNISDQLELTIDPFWELMGELGITQEDIFDRVESRHQDILHYHARFTGKAYYHGDSEPRDIILSSGPQKCNEMWHALDKKISGAETGDLNWQTALDRLQTNLSKATNSPWDRKLPNYNHLKGMLNQVATYITTSFPEASNSGKTKKIKKFIEQVAKSENGLGELFCGETSLYEFLGSDIDQNIASKIQIRILLSVCYLLHEAPAALEFIQGDKQALYLGTDPNSPPEILSGALLQVANTGLSYNSLRKKLRDNLDNTLTVREESKSFIMVISTEGCTFLNAFMASILTSSESDEHRASYFYEKCDSLRELLLKAITTYFSLIDEPIEDKNAVYEACTSLDTTLRNWANARGRGDPSCDQMSRCFNHLHNAISTTLEQSTLSISDQEKELLELLNNSLMAKGPAQVNQDPINNVARYTGNRFFHNSLLPALVGSGDVSFLGQHRTIQVSLQCQLLLSITNDLSHAAKHKANLILQTLKKGNYNDLSILATELHTKNALLIHSEEKSAFEAVPHKKDKANLILGTPKEHNDNGLSILDTEPHAKNALLIHSEEKNAIEVFNHGSFPLFLANNTQLEPTYNAETKKALALKILKELNNLLILHIRGKSIPPTLLRQTHILASLDIFALEQTEAARDYLNSLCKKVLSEYKQLSDSDSQLLHDVLDMLFLLQSDQSLGKSTTTYRAQQESENITLKNLPFIIFSTREGAFRQLFLKVIIDLINQDESLLPRLLYLMLDTRSAKIPRRILDLPNTIRSESAQGSELTSLYETLVFTCQTHLSRYLEKIVTEGHPHPENYLTQYCESHPQFTKLIIGLPTEKDSMHFLDQATARTHWPESKVTDIEERARAAATAYFMSLPKEINTTQVSSARAYSPKKMPQKACRFALPCLMMKYPDEAEIISQQAQTEFYLYLQQTNQTDIASPRSTKSSGGGTPIPREEELTVDVIIKRAIELNEAFSIARNKIAPTEAENQKLKVSSAIVPLLSLMLNGKAKGESKEQDVNAKKIKMMGQLNNESFDSLGAEEKNRLYKAIASYKDGEIEGLDAEEEILRAYVYVLVARLLNPHFIAVFVLNPQPASCEQQVHKKLPESKSRHSGLFKLLKLSSKKFPRGHVMHRSASAPTLNEV